MTLSRAGLQHDTGWVDCQVTHFSSRPACYRPSCSATCCASLRGGFPVSSDRQGRHANGGRASTLGATSSLPFSASARAQRQREATSSLSLNGDVRPSPMKFEGVSVVPTTAMASGLENAESPKNSPVLTASGASNTVGRTTRRSGRAVECAGLENRKQLEPTARSKSTYTQPPRCLSPDLSPTLEEHPDLLDVIREWSALPTT